MDIRLDAEFPTHPKTLKLLRRCQGEGLASLIQLWCWAAKNRPKGDLTGMDWEDVELAAGWPLTREPGQLFNALVKLRWIDSLGDGKLRLHNWEKRQEYVFESEERSQAARKAAKSRWDAVKGLPRHPPEDAESMRPASFPQCPSPLLSSPSASPIGDAKEGDPSDLLSENGISDPPQVMDPLIDRSIIELWNIDVAGRFGLPKSQPGGKNLIAQLRGRRQDYPDAKRRDLSWWRQLFAMVTESDFLCGRREGDERPFQATLLWVSGRKNCEKILSGQYVNRRANPRQLTAVSRANQATMQANAEAPKYTPSKLLGNGGDE